MIFAIHKLKNYLLGNEFLFYVNHMTLVHLVNKRQVSSHIVIWLFLFLKYEFTLIYKPRLTHVVTNALSMLLDIIEPTCVLNQTTYATLFHLQPAWLQDVKDYL